MRSTLLAMACLTAACCVPGMATAKAPTAWIKAESTHFIVYSDNSEADIRDYVGKLETFDQLTDKIYSTIGDSELPDYRKTTFYYLRDVSDIGPFRSNPRYGLSPVMTCMFEDDQLYSVKTDSASKAKDPGYVDYDLAYLYLDYTRHKTVKYFSYTLPAWADMGLTYYFMTVNIQGDKVIVGQPFPDLLHTFSDHTITTQQLVPFDALIGGHLPRVFDMNTYHLQTWMLVSYFMSDPLRKAKFVDYLEKVGAGEESTAAFKEATGMSAADFTAIFNDYMTKGSPQFTYPYKAGAAADIIVTPVALYSQPLPLLASMVKSCPSAADGRQFLASAQDVAAKFPDDDLAQTVFAIAEVNFGDLKGEGPSAALSVLQKRLAVEPDDFDARLLLGRLYLSLAEDGADRDANYVKARQELVKAYNLDPTSAPLLYFYVMSQRNLAGFPDDNAVAALDLAQSCSRNAYYLLKAEFDVRRGDMDDAATQLSIDCHICKGEYWATYHDIQLALAAKTPAADILPLFDKIEYLRPNG